MKLIPLDPTKINPQRRGRRGRVSYPILKMFLESGETAVELDREGIQSSFQGLYSALGSYIKNHQLPIAMWSEAGKIRFARTDTDESGKPNPENNDIDKIEARNGTSGYEVNGDDENGGPAIDTDSEDEDEVSEVE